jgi:archaellum component FlaC
MTAVTDSDLKRLEDLIIGIANGQKAIENGLTAIETRMTGIETRMTGIETRMTTLETRMTGIEGEQSKLIGKVDGMDKRLIIIETKLDEWKPSMARITDLAEKVGELKNWRSIAFLILGATAGWIARNSFTNNP